MRSAREMHITEYDLAASAVVEVAIGCFLMLIPGALLAALYLVSWAVRQ